jgi:hypothetical protein
MNRKKPYSKTVPIIQSSGSGKSRMVDKLAHCVFTLPFNLRLKLDNCGTCVLYTVHPMHILHPVDLAFPPPDEQVLDHLTRYPTLFDPEPSYLFFLTNLFKHVTAELAQKKFSKCASPSDLASSWRAHLEHGGVRRNLYDSVIEKCSSSRLGKLDASAFMNFID